MIQPLFPVGGRWRRTKNFAIKDKYAQPRKAREAATRVDPVLRILATYAQLPVFRNVTPFTRHPAPRVLVSGCAVGNNRVPSFVIEVEL